jgi:hypothetical protein
MFRVQFVDTTHFLPFQDATGTPGRYLPTYAFKNIPDFQHLTNNFRALNSRWPAANRHSGVNQRLRSAALIHAAMNECRRSAALIHAAMNECRRSAALIHASVNECRRLAALVHAKIAQNHIDWMLNFI